MLILAIIVILGGAEGQLVENFYGFTCPNVEFIVQQAVSTKFSQTFVTIPATLRLFFHDCFVEVIFCNNFSLELIKLLLMSQCPKLVL